MCINFWSQLYIARKIKGNIYQFYTKLPWGFQYSNVIQLRSITHCTNFTCYNPTQRWQLQKDFSSKESGRTSINLILILLLKLALVNWARAKFEYSRVSSQFCIAGCSLFLWVHFQTQSYLSLSQLEQSLLLKVNHNLAGWYPLPHFPCSNNYKKIMVNWTDRASQGRHWPKWWLSSRPHRGSKRWCFPDERMNKMNLNVELISSDQVWIRCGCTWKDFQRPLQPLIKRT